MEEIGKYVFGKSLSNKYIYIGNKIKFIDSNALNCNYTIRAYIQKDEGTISGSPFGAYNGNVKWLGEYEVVYNADPCFVFRKNEDNSLALLLAFFKNKQYDDIYIKDKYDGIPVYSIEENSFTIWDYHSVHIPSSVMKIADNFCHAYVRYLYIDKERESIPGEEIWGSGSAVIWNDTEIVDGVIYGEDEDKAWVYGFLYPNTKMRNISIRESIHGKPVKSVKYRAFYESSIEHISIPLSVDEFCESAFEEFNADSFTIPRWVKVIGDYCFDSSKIRHINYDSDADIQKGVFEYATIESLDINGNVKKIGRHAFDSSEKLKKISIPPTVREIWRYTFQDSELEEISIPASLEMWEYAFGDVGFLKKVKIQDGVTQVPEGAFSYSEVSELLLPNHIKIIGECAFEGTDIERINVVSCECIKNYAFYDCAKLADVKLGFGVMEIGRGCFYSCSIMEKIMIMNKAMIINQDADTIPDTAAIYGWAGSTAQEYATTYSRNFVAIDTFPVVSFYGFDGTLINREIVEPNGNATPPRVPGTMEDGYNVTWDGEYRNVTENMDIHAVSMEIETYSVTFVSWDGTTLKTEMVRYLDDAIAPETPVRSGYLFTGWDGIYKEVTSNLIVTAIYEAYVDVSEIIIEQKAYEITNGDIINIPYKVVPDGATNKGVSIDMSDETVVDVEASDGWLVCSGINEGKTTITVTSVDNTSFSDSCTVTVKANKKITGISVYPQNLVVQTGKSDELSVTVNGGIDADSAVVWSTSDPGVATIKSGKVKGIAEGTAIITVRSKEDSKVYDSCSISVENKKDFITDSYQKTSIQKDLIIHSVSGKFKDITNEHIDGDSMTLKESICESSTLALGGCIANRFEVQILSRELYTKIPSGEIQVYQMIEGCKVYLFHGIIYSADRIGNSLKRKLVAYDNLYSKGNKNMAHWFKKLKMPMPVKKFRTLLFKEIGIKQSSAVLDIDECIIAPASYKEVRPTIDIITGDVVETKKVEIENYVISSSSIKATDMIKDLCEAAGMCGWMNRKGIFEYIDLQDTEIEKLDNVIDLSCSETYYIVECTMLEKENEKMYWGSKLIEIDTGEDIPILQAVDYKKEVENATYVLTENNFMVQVMVSTDPESDYYGTRNSTKIVQAVHTRASVPCPKFSCRRKFSPFSKLGNRINGTMIKETSENEKYSNDINSRVLSRTIKGAYTMLETISAQNGPFNASNDTSKKNIKSVHVTQELNTSKISKLNATKLEGVGLTRAQYEALERKESDTMTYFVRNED